MKQEKDKNVGIYINGASKKSVKRVERSVLAVLHTEAGDEVKKAAIQALASSIAPPISIAGCSVNMGHQAD